MMLGMLGGAGGLLSGGSLLKMGFMAASAAGMYLLNGKKEKGEVARLDDTKVSCSAYGRGIPLVYGTMRVTGNMFWATDFEERLRYMHPKGKGGKKGEKKGTPYYEYHANFAMALCEGPVEEVLRIWADSNLIYDKHNPRNKDLVGPGFSQSSGGGGKTGMGGSKKKGGDGGDSGRFRFRFYSGTEEQMPDPFMVRKQGADLVPAHRGLCYLFFEHFALADFGNRTPTITAEVSVRKKQQIAIATMENMDLTGTNFQQFTAFVDIERYRLYSIERDTIANEDCMRVYDLSTEKEIRRIYLSDIAAANAGRSDFPDNIGFNFIDGICGNGDILIVFNNFRNSVVIGFIDFSSLLMVRRFGSHGNSLSNGPNRIVSVNQVRPVAYVSVEVGFDGEVEAEPERATMIKSAGGNVYMFSDRHEPLCYFDLPGGVSTGISELIPIKVDIFGGELMFTYHSNTGHLARLYRAVWGMATSTNPDTGITTIIPASGTEASVTLVRELSNGGTNFNFISTPQYIMGAERVVWFEELRYNDPLENGMYSVSAVVNENGTDINNLTITKISDNTGHMPPAGTAPVPFNTSNGTKWIIQATNTVVSYDVFENKLKSYSVGNKIPGMGGHQTYWPARGAIITTILDPTDGNERKWSMVLIDRNEQTPADIHFILSDIAKRVHIPAAKLDFTLLNPQDIMGYIIENPTSARRVVEDLAQIFMFDVVESDYRLKYVSRGQESIVTVPQKDLAIIDNETYDYFNEIRSQEIDLPQTVVVSYINAEKDYVTNSQHYRRPRSPMAVMQSHDKLEINLPMALTKDFAKQLAHKVCMSLWTERINYEVMLPWKYMKYDPTDVMTFTMDDSLTFTTRMMKMDLGANLSIECSGVSQTPAAYTSNIQAGDDGGVIRDPKPFPPPSDAHVLNIPYLEDGDDVGSAQFSYYLGAAAFGPGLRGAAIEYRISGQPWKFAGLVSQELVWGRTLDAVPEPPNGPFATDDQTVITLLPAHSFEDEGGLVYSWESIPESQWPSTDNCIVIGEEIIYFRDVAVQPGGAVEISHLIRGARGTENAAYNHTALERFCVVTDGLLQTEGPFAFANQLWMFRSFSGFTPLPTHKYDITLTGASHKPWGPNYFQRIEIGVGLRITWNRRTRLGGAMVDGSASVPLNEESESYEIYLLDEPYDPDFFDPNNPATYVRKVGVSNSMEFKYYNDMMSEDSWNRTMPLHLVAFQVSAVIGRGFPGYATLNPSILT